MQNESNEIPPEPDYSEEGVDRTLIRWMMSLTPAERLQVIQDQLNALEALKEELETD